MGCCPASYVYRVLNAVDSSACSGQQAHRCTLNSWGSWRPTLTDSDRLGAERCKYVIFTTLPVRQLEPPDICIN